jgi:hypothetical protein
MESENQECVKEGGELFTSFFTAWVRPSSEL